MKEKKRKGKEKKQEKERKKKRRREEEKKRRREEEKKKKKPSSGEGGRTLSDSRAGRFCEKSSLSRIDDGLVRIFGETGRVAGKRLCLRLRAPRVDARSRGRGGSKVECPIVVLLR